MPTRVIHVTDLNAVERLAARILAPRPRPIVVVSSDPTSGEFAIDPAQLAEEIGDIADVELIETGVLTFALSDRLPPRAQVYGGAGRSYPVDFGAHPHPARSPLRFPGPRTVVNLASDVLTHASAAGLFEQARPTQVVAEGVITGFLLDGDRALVDVAGYGLATIAHELTLPGLPWLPLNWVVHEGQRVAGAFDPKAKRFHLDVQRHVVAEAVSRFAHHSVTLALVRAVTANTAVLALHPEIKITVQRLDVSPNPFDTLDLLLAEGDVVAVRVIHLSTGELHLTMSDVGDAEPIVPALPIVVGGDPWLVEGRDLPHGTGDGAGEALAALDAHVRGATAALSLPPAAPGGAATAVPSAEAPSVGAPSSIEAAPMVAAPPVVEAQPPERPRPGPGLRLAALDATNAPAPTAGVPQGDPDQLARPEAPAEAPAEVPSVGRGPGPAPAEGAPQTDPDQAARPAARPAAPAVGQAATPSAAPAAGPGQGAARAHGTALQSVQLQLAAAKGRIALLEEQLSAAGADESGIARLTARAAGADARLREELVARAEVERELRALRDTHKQSVQQLRIARKSQAHGVPTRAARAERRSEWISREAWIRHEIMLAWVARVSALERAEWPLEEYAVGPDFVESTESLDEGQLTKALRCAVDAVTGRIREISGREVHALRVSDVGGSPEVVRDDGAKCMRAYIEKNTASARRLHYWVLPGGGVELSRVALHDDMRP